MQSLLAKIRKGSPKLSAAAQAPGMSFQADPTSAVAQNPRLIRANRLLEAGDYGQAETLLRQLVADEPEEPEYLASLAICLALGSGKYLTAEKLAARAKRLAPHRGAGWFALGYINLLGSRLERGYLYLNEGRRRAPRDPRLRYGLDVWQEKRPPVISDLAPDHVLNRMLGGVRRVFTDRRVLLAGSGWLVYRLMMVVVLH